MTENKVCHILMLEDMDNDVELIKRAAKKAIPTAVFNVAKTKEEFLEKLNWGVPNVILSDYNIPGYSGLEAMYHVRSIHAHIPFIFVTGMLDDEEKVAKAILAGASGYVLKDKLNTLADVLHAVLKTSEARYAKEEEERNRIRGAKLKLQKINALLEQADLADSNKDAIMRLVTEVQENLILA